MLDARQIWTENVHNWRKSGPEDVSSIVSATADNGGLGIKSGFTHCINEVFPHRPSPIKAMCATFLLLAVGFCCVFSSGASTGVTVSVPAVDNTLDLSILAVLLAVGSALASARLYALSLGIAAGTLISGPGDVGIAVGSSSRALRNEFQVFHKSRADAVWSTEGLFIKEGSRDLPCEGNLCSRPTSGSSASAASRVQESLEDKVKCWLSERTRCSGFEGVLRNDVCPEGTVTLVLAGDALSDVTEVALPTTKLDSVLERELGLALKRLPGLGSQ